MKNVIRLDNYYSPEDFAKAIGEFLKYYNKLEKVKSIFNLEKIKEHISSFGGEYNRLTTLAMYFSEVEKRYKDKIQETKI